MSRDALAAFDRPFERDFTPPSPGPLFPRWSPPSGARPGESGSSPCTAAKARTAPSSGLLEARRIAFTGPGADASARAFDKEVAKQVASGAGVRIAHSVHLSKDPKVMREELRDMTALYRRIVAKPVAGGSSVGLYHLDSASQAETARRIEQSGERYLAEEFVSGTELTVGVVDGPKGARALPPSEVRLDQGRAFDFEGKYLGKGTQEITPAESAAGGFAGGAGSRARGAPRAGLRGLLAHRR